MKKLFTGLMLALAGFTLNAQSLRDSLLYNYKMNGDLIDETGNGPAGSINGSSLTTDRFGNANSAILIGTGSVPTIAHDASNTNMNDAFTVSMWINPTSITGVEKVMLAKLSGGDRKLVLRLQDDGKTHSHFNSGGLKFCTSDNAVISINTWQHLVYTWDGNIMTHYLNGQLLKSCDFTGESINFNAGEWALGNLTATGNEKFAGSIDDLKMYSRSLISDEVENLYNLENQADPEFLSLTDSLLIYLPLNGTDFSDASGNGYDGTDVNTNQAIDRFDNMNGAKSFVGGTSGSRRVTIPHSADFQKLNTGFTMTAWAKRVGGGGAFLAKLNGSDRKIVWRMEGSNTGVHFNDGGLKFATSDSTLGTSEWIQIAISWDGQTIRHYQNGELDDEISFPLNTLNFNAGDWSIGALSVNGGEEFGGELDDIRIYNRVLSDEQLVNLHEAETLSEGLVLDYDFNGNFEDASLFQNILTPNDVSEFVIGQNGTINSAVYFDGVNDYYSLAHDPSYKFNAPMTISTWIYLNDSSDLSRILTTNDDASVYKGIVLQTSGSKISFSVGDGGGAGPGDRKTATGNTTLNSKQWYHVVVAVTTPADVAIYLNGTPETVTISGSGLFGVSYDSQDGKIGTFDRSPSAQTYFHGSIDDLKMWNRTLNATEATMLYQPAFNNDLGTITSLFDKMEIYESQSLNIFPNPNTGIVNIQTDKNIVSLNLLGIDGSLVEALEASSSINLSNQENGCYFIEAIFEDGTSETNKIIVSK